MEKKYYITADGGGSKLHAVLYDESFNVINTVKTTGTNMNFMPRELVRKNFTTVLDTFLLGEVKKIERMDLCLVTEQPFIKEIIDEYDKNIEVAFHMETPSSLATALTETATTVLSGTGSGASHIKNGQRLVGIGGWGSLLGDEGSGYDIGLGALKAAIYSYDGRGKKTLLEDLVRKKYDLGDYYFGLVHTLIKSENTRGEVASCAMLASEAARLGDEVAIEIFNGAAESLFHIFKTLCEKYPDYYSGKVVAIGGAWKGYGGMFERFCELVKKFYPDATVTRPIYDAAVGPMVRRLFAEGYDVSEIKNKISSGFSSLLYKYE